MQAALRRVGLNGPETPKVAALGQVFESDRLRNRFVDYLTLQWPSFALTEPVGDIVDGWKLRSGWHWPGGSPVARHAPLRGPW